MSDAPPINASTSHMFNLIFSLNFKVRLLIQRLNMGLETLSENTIIINSLQLQIIIFYCMSIYTHLKARQSGRIKQINILINVLN